MRLADLIGASVMQEPDEPDDEEDDTAVPPDPTTEEALPRSIGQGLCHESVTRTSRPRFPHPLNPRAATRERSGGGVPDQDLLVVVFGLGSVRLRLIWLRLFRLRASFPAIACCASSIAFFWVVHRRSTRSVNAFLCARSAADRLALSLRVVTDLDAALLFEELLERLLPGLHQIRDRLALSLQLVAIWS